jgi:AcrR family transcriptional regulator
VTKADQTRARILTAAENVVLRDGVGHLTLESTAAEAGLSKGGVLYHFGTRDALVEAMVRRLIDSFHADLADRQAADPAPAGSFTRAYVRATFEPGCPPETERENRLGAALVAAASAEPVLLAPLQADFAEMQRGVEGDGIDPARATVARLAADGLWLAELFGLGPIDPALRARVAGVLIDLTEAGP